MESLQFTRVLDEFLFEFPAPSPSDWKSLLADHPEFAADIADFAAVWMTVRHVEEGDVISNFTTAEVESPSLAYALKKGGGSGSTDPLNFLDSLEGQDELAAAVGLKSFPELLLGVVMGQVAAPLRVLDFLVRKLNSTRVAVAAMFMARHLQLEGSFSSDAAPETVQQLTWDEEVFRVVSAPEERIRLLAMNQE